MEEKQSSFEQFYLPHLYAVYDLARFVVTPIEHQCFWGVAKQFDGSFVTRVPGHYAIKNPHRRSPLSYHREAHQAEHCGRGVIAASGHKIARDGAHGSAGI